MQWKKMLVVDLECTCFQSDDSDKPDGWEANTHQEIIEIGAVLVHLPSREIETYKSFLVKPHGPMGEFCKELTSLTYADVENSPRLPEAIQDMRAWCKANRFDIQSMPWGSWGDYDRVQFYRECARKGLKYPYGRAHYNIKGLFSILEGRSKGFGVEAALSLSGMEFNGRPHRGLDDARNIANLLLRTLGSR